MYINSEATGVSQYNTLLYRHKLPFWTKIFSALLNINICWKVLWLSYKNGIMLRYNAGMVENKEAEILWQKKGHP